MAIGLVCMSMMLLFTRGHYSIDIFGGLVIGHYLWMQAENWSWIIDYGLMRIPFHKRFQHFQQKCGMCKAPINTWVTVLYENKVKKIDDEVDKETAQQLLVLEIEEEKEFSY